MISELRKHERTWKTVMALAVLCLMLAGSGAMMTRVAAQEVALTADSPIVGVWVTPPRGEESGSITTFSADGSLVDHETDGTFALGAWEATGPTSANATLVFFANDDEFTGSITVRTALEYDEATDSITATYSVTGALPDGTEIWTSEELSTATLTRLLVEGPKLTAEQIGGSSMVRIPPITTDSNQDLADEQIGGSSMVRIPPLPGSAALDTPAKPGDEPVSASAATPVAWSGIIKQH